jgi:hypothetical protein
MWSIKKIPSNLSNWISFLRKMHFSNECRKRKTNLSWPLTLIMQKHDHSRLLRHHYSESPVIPLSNDIWYRCVAHGFITFYFLIFYRWSIMLAYSPLFVYKQERIIRFQWMNQRRNEKLHPDGQYTDHLSMGRAF